ncbi:cysteinyl-tRNA synthetase [Frankia casuarinae]|uniref:Cysteine--tRNA ligase n=1 Tax=Frankia casuarinae (strain DSM 45818 / CECT 9043 / HFP020203 / CcI3) TaxID=106370 RepID=SYC_FRACC|nr:MULTISPECIES: cysteine--tRNA ligase [Frankia]Q2J545.1 RecName: Full=Cysteine--tRNA ligase; AltName: Full=Cysteinyl-tRNA synthetase; Short=CysRS [Frankia casuarinae]ABD13597.1 cysteinyl-tRNA synthetase [Frankia casuarinae]EYT92740.1 cysteinyl-tRNA synthetase [Frankia casuarinae]KDA42078.1 cysteinyl-tRNA synthetase [Frankia sp. BMG5.23]ORT96786.1 cysteine--tRNA ligase [Frankia casuarinae]
MGLHLYDTRRRRVRPFEPLRPGHVGVYVCGPTVQAAPHVGHIRTALPFDLLRRWLVQSGRSVTFVQNVTDIDDKIIINADRDGTSVWELATRQTRAFDDAYRTLGILPPTIQPRATGHIPEMIALVSALVEGGYAYASGGSVWFRVGAFADYGALSHQRPDAMQPSVEAEPGKADPRDFALWKAARPGEPFWSSPWGDGRPGWHLECSAMAGKYLGPVFDIHGGGLDLVFPHHENERAQTVCAATARPASNAASADSPGPGGGEPGGGEPSSGEMARYWMHVGLLTTGGTKMSKSLGNSVLVADALDAVRPQVLRYHLLSAHYRSTLEYSAEALAESTAAHDRVETFVRNALDILGGPGEAAALAADEVVSSVAGAQPTVAGARPVPVPGPGGESRLTPRRAWSDFTIAMDDDLAVGRALAALFGAVSQGNQVLSKAHSRELAGWVDVTRRMLNIFGLDPHEQWPTAGAEFRPALDGAMQVVLDLRSAARARRDYAEADAIRSRLAAAGLIVEDTPEGQRWHLA